MYKRRIVEIFAIVQLSSERQFTTDGVFDDHDGRLQSKKCQRAYRSLRDDKNDKCIQDGLDTTLHATFCRI